MTIVRRLWLAGVFVLFVEQAGVSQEKTILNETIKPIHFETLQVPILARLSSRGAKGIVVVRLSLDDAGRVRSSTAISGPKDLVSHCLENSKKWIFQPNNEKTVVIVYWFRTQGLCNRPCPSHFSFEPPNLAIIVMNEPVVEY